MRPGTGYMVMHLARRVGRRPDHRKVYGGEANRGMNGLLWGIALVALGIWVATLIAFL